VVKKPTYEELEQRIKELEWEVSERKKAGNVIDETESKLKTILSSMDDLVFSFDKDGRFIFYHSPSTRKLYLSPEKFMGKKHSDVMPPHINKLFADAFKKNKKGEVAEYEYCMEIYNDIRWFSVKSSAIFVGDIFTGSVAVVRDMTDRIKTEQALRESEEKYRTLFEKASDAIFLVDTKIGRIFHANQRAEQLLGRPMKEIIGMHQSELHPPHLAEYYKHKFREHVEQGEVFDLEAEVIKKDGSIVPVIICASVINLQGKEMIQGLFKDISSEKMIIELKEEIISRKLVENAKSILMDRYKISEGEARRRLQKESRRQRKKMKEIAQAVISSKLILD